MWIDNSVSKPLRKGYYKTLVDFDGFTLKESEKDLFNGVNWDIYESNTQFIRYWFADKEDYQTISDFKQEAQKWAEDILAKSPTLSHEETICQLQEFMILGRLVYDNKGNWIPQLK